MKKITAIVVSCFLLSVAAAQSPSSARMTTEESSPRSELARFDLDFPGGTPGELVAAIEKATGKPLNAVIPTEHAGYRLPSLRMKAVNVAELFTALLHASTRQRAYGRQWMETYAGFMPPGGYVSGGSFPPANEATVWYFKVQEPSHKPATRFYLLTPYLERGVTVDDITTAVQTAWKLAGESPVPTLNFHRETNLLIGVGPEWQLQTIDDVLKALAPENQGASSPERAPSA